MRYHKPDIIVILAVLVTIGVIATTAVQAGELTDQDITAVSPRTLADGAEKMHCDACPAHVRHRDVILGPQTTDRRGHGLAAGDQAVLGSGSQRSPKGFYQLRGMRYDLMFNSFHAVMYMGGSSVDFTLKVDNLHTPADELNPYLSLSLGSHW